MRSVCIGTILIVTLAETLVATALGEMPLGFTEAMNTGNQEDVLNVKNYDTGASMTEDYRNIEHLKRDTQISTRTFSVKPPNSELSGATNGGGLEASINSDFVGKAHIAWQSVDPTVTVHGRHPITGRSIEDLTGVFTIEKFIQLWSGSTPGEISVDWLPCT